MIGGPACGTRKIVPDGETTFFFPVLPLAAYHETPKYPEPAVTKVYVYRQELDAVNRCSRTQDGNAFRFTYRGIE